MTERTPRYIQEEIDWEQPQEDERQELLHLALEKYGLSPLQLRELATSQQDLTQAIREGTASEDMLHLMKLIGDIFRPRAREQIRSPSDIAAYLIARYGISDQEEFSVTSLDTKNRVLDTHTLYRGTVDTAQVRVIEVFKPAVRLNASSIIISHSHPSTIVEPSPEDILLTKHIVDAGKLLDCHCRDHIITGHGRWYSMAERGIGGFSI